MDFEEARHVLVEKLAQRSTDGITDDDVLRALHQVQRHLFVQRSQREFAYEDRALPLSCGQTISQPLVVGMMTEWLRLEKDHRVLEIGTGSGYQCAVLAEIAKAVFTVEYHLPLYERARQLLSQLGYENIHFRMGDGYHGWSEKAPFDSIIVTCHVPQVPKPLVAQIRDGSRLVIPTGPDHDQQLIAYEKRGRVIEPMERLPVRFVPLLRK